MADNRFEFRYTANDVASAQRLRLFRSKQIRVMLAFWLVSSLFLTAPLLFPQFFPGASWMSWGLVIEIALIYLVTLAILFFLTPYLDFLFNRSWHLPLAFQFNEKQVRLSVSGGKSPGLTLPWKQIQRIEENQRVYIFYYGTGNKFMILPKSIFKRPQDDRRFRELLKRNIATAPSAEEAKPETSAPVKE